MENPLKGHRIEYHILQSFPVTCLNYDDVGSPKSAIVGGVGRARVSSQCWKRQIRLALRGLGVKCAIRTKKVEAVLFDAMKKAGASDDQAKTCSETAAQALAENTLFFFAPSEAEAIARFAAENGFDPSALATEKKAREAKKNSIAPGLKKLLAQRRFLAADGIDIALFGRMVAMSHEIHVEAACSVAHAITIHGANSELDFYTALDDLQDCEPGSAHMGAHEFSSGTFYRYISLDLGLLYGNLGGENVVDAVAAFTKALWLAVPMARQATMAGLRPWDYAVVQIRKGQGMQASFEKPVKSRDGGYLEPGIAALREQLRKSEKMAGSLYGKIGEFVLGDEEDEKAVENIDALADVLAAHVRLAASK